MFLQVIETTLVVLSGAVTAVVLGTCCNRKAAVATLLGVTLAAVLIPWPPDVREVVDRLRAEAVASGQARPEMEALYARAVWISARQKFLIVLGAQLLGVVYLRICTCLLPLAWLMRCIGLCTALQLRAVEAAKAQYVARQRGIGAYVIFTGEKPVL